MVNGVLMGAVIPAFKLLAGPTGSLGLQLLSLTALLLMHLCTYMYMYMYTVLPRITPNFWEIWFYVNNFFLCGYKLFAGIYLHPFNTFTEVYGTLLVNHRNE